MTDENGAETQAQVGKPENPYVQMAGRAERPQPKPMFEMVGELPPLFAALAKAQGEFPEITKNETADAGKYQYDYADLSVVLRGIRPGLSANGLCLMQPIDGGTENGYSIRTILAHTSGAYISCRVLVPYEANPQEFGKKVTYSRRYSVMSLVGVFPRGEDDDALPVGATHAPKTSANPPKTPAPKRQQAEPTPAGSAAPVSSSGKPAVSAPAAITPPAGGPDVEEHTKPMLDVHEETVKKNGAFDPNGPMSDDQRKEITAHTHGGKAWPDAQGKPFREPFPPDPKTGLAREGERWAILNTARCNEIAMKHVKVPFAQCKTWALANALIGALRNLPDMPSSP